MAFLLLVAGHETTVNLIASGVLALLLNPAELARLRADPALIGGAVEELLRYVNPVNHTTFRCATEPVEIGGVRIGRGDPVLVALSGANRDPARFGDPDQLDLGRDSSGHLAFGHGIHYCLGAPLAGWRPRSPSPACWRGSARSASPSRRPRCAGGRARSSTAWSRCRYGSPRERPGLSPGPGRSQPAYHLSGVKTRAPGR